MHFAHTRAATKYAASRTAYTGSCSSQVRQTPHAAEAAEAISWTQTALLRKIHPATLHAEPSREALRAVIVLAVCPTQSAAKAAKPTGVLLTETNREKTVPDAKIESQPSCMREAD